MADHVSSRPRGAGRDGAARSAESLLVDDRPASAPLWDVDALSARIVTHLRGTVAPCATLPRDAIDGDITATVRACLASVTSSLEASTAERPLGPLRQSAAQWAREGIPLDVIHHAVHEGLKVALAAHVETAAAAGVGVAIDIGLRLVDAIGEVTATIASAYLAELRSVAAEQHAASQTLVTALLGGRLTPTVIRQCGVTLADSYFVVPVTISARTPQPSNRPRRPYPALRRAATIRGELGRHCQGALCLLHNGEGTLLIPIGHGDHKLDSLIAYLADATATNITAVAVVSDTAQISSAYRWARELLELAERSNRGPGVYRFPDLAMDYQLTRPGRGLKPLSTLLEPLEEEYPELLETLSLYFTFSFNVTRTARALSIHPNTLRYRFDRIAAIVGVDPGSPKGVWQLHSAWLAAAAAPPSARSHDRGEHSADRAGVSES